MEIELEDLEKFIEKRIKELKIPGLSIGIVKDGTAVYSRGYGFADIESNKKMTPKNVLRFASISKTFTTIGLFQLWEQGKFNLDDPINQYLPNGRIRPKKKNAPPITFKHLLTHMSGMGEILKRSDLFKIPHFVNKNPKKIYSLEKLFNRNIKLKIAPGEKWCYANFGFHLLGYIIELISGVEFSEYMIRNIFNPLEMINTDFVWSDRVKVLQAKGYKLKKGKNIEFGTRTQVQMPAGSIYSSINDMMKYMICLLNGGKTQNGEIIKSETLKMIWNPQFQLDERLRAIGYVFWIYNLNGNKILNHGGSINGYLSEMFLIPEENLGIIIGINQMLLRNMDAIRIAHEILHKILKIKDPKKKLEEITLKSDNLNLKKFKGRYGTKKGILTNTRFLSSTGEIKVKPQNNDLIYKTMWGKKKKGVKLWKVDEHDPLYYFIIDNLDYGTVPPYETVIFQEDSKGNIKSLYKGFNEYIKKPWYKTFKFKLYSRVLITISTILIFILFLIFF